MLDDDYPFHNDFDDIDLEDLDEEELDFGDDEWVRGYDGDSL
jgi:hypothetical protein